MVAITSFFRVVLRLYHPQKGTRMLPRLIPIFIVWLESLFAFGDYMMMVIK